MPKRDTLRRIDNPKQKASGQTVIYGGVAAPPPPISPIEQIGGWRIGPTYLQSRDALLSADGFLQLGQGDEIVRLDSDDPDYRLWIGDAIPADAPFSVTKDGELTASAGEIGGWEIGAEALVGGNAILHSSGYLLLGTGDDVVRLDATDALYRLWAGDADAADAPFSVTREGALRAKNVEVSGSIRSAVFDRDLVNAHAGTLVIAKSAGRVTAEFTVGDTLVMDTPPGGGWLFEDDDIVRIKAADASTDSWFTVTRTGALNEYTTVYAGGDDAVTYPAGSVATDYGQSGQGYLLLTADLSGAPYYSVRTHDGEPWATENEVVRLGNLNGAFGIIADTPGLGIGNSATGNYMLGTALGVQILAGSGATSLGVEGLSLSLPEGDVSVQATGGETIKWIRDVGDALYYPFTMHTQYWTTEDVLRGYIRLDGQQVESTTESELMLSSLGPDYWLTLLMDSAEGVNISIYDVGGDVIAASMALTPSALTLDVDLLASADARIVGGLYVGSLATDPPDDVIIADGYIRGLELRLPASLRISEFASGTDTYPNLYRNAYYTGSEWKRVFADQDATILSIGADGTFKVLHATDTNDTADSAITWAERFRVSEVGRTSVHMLNLAGVLPGNALTIASDAITVTGSFHTVDTEGGASSDSLATINGGSFGDLLILKPANDARTVVVKDGTGNLHLARSDFNMDGLWDTITLFRWSDGYWYELSRSDNRA